jgi:hypothetical protein
LARFPFGGLINEGFSVKVLPQQIVVLENAEIQAFQVVLAKVLQDQYRIVRKALS